MVLSVFCFNFADEIKNIKIMARTSTATVRLVQKMNRQMKDGTYPIYIVVCFSGRVEKATGVSCIPKHWNAKQQVIKPGCPNAPVLNQMLSDIINNVRTRKNELEFAGRKYTAGMLLENSINDLHATGTYWDVCQKLIDERRLKDGTYRSYLYTYRKLCEYLSRKEFIVEELNLGVVKDFSLWMEKSGIKINTIKRVLSCIAAAWNFAISRKLADASGYPFNEFKYTSVYKECPRDYYLEESHIRRLRDYWLDMVVVRDGNLWHYRPGAEERLGQRWTAEFGILWFLMMYKMNGSSPADVVLLRPEQCKRITVNGGDYWSIDTRRKKTARNVHIRMKRDLLVIIGLEHFLGHSGHFIYPALYWKEGVTDKELLEQSHHVSHKAIKHVRNAFLSINEDIAKENVDKPVKEPLVDVQRVVMYTARHSFAQHYLNKPGATVNGLASLMARSPNTIATYIKQLTRDEEIVEMVDDLVI